MNNRVFVILALALLVLCALAAGLPARRAAAAPSQQSGSGGSITYTSDGKACVRELEVDCLACGGGGGDEPYYYALESSGGDNAFVVREVAHPGATYVAYVQPAGQLMITREHEGDDVRVWEAATGKYKTAMRHPKGLRQVVVAGSRPTVATTDGEGRAWLWDLSKVPIPTPRLIATSDRYWWAAALSPDGRYLALAEKAVHWSDGVHEEHYGVVRLINTSTGAERHLVGSIVRPAERDRSGNLTSAARIGYGHGATINHLQFSSDGQVLLTSSNDGTVRMWRVSTGEHLRCYEIGDDDTWFKFALSPNDREFLSEQDSQITLWNALTGRVVRRFGVPESYQVLLSEYELRYGTTHAIGFKPDGAAVFQSFSNEVRIWNTQTGRLQGVIRVEPEDWVSSAAYSSDGRHLALASNWDSTEGVLVTVSDHRVTQAAATATRYVEAGLELGLQGDIRGMVNALREAEASDPFRQIRAAKVFAFAARNALAWNNRYVNSSRYDKFLAAIPAAPARLTLDARDWNGICWFGSLATRTDLFIGYCDKAVAAASTSQRAGYRDSRAIARMFRGDRTGAIADLTAFVDYYKTSEPAQARLRQSWIDALRNGRDPEVFLNTTALWTE